MCIVYAYAYVSMHTQVCICALGGQKLSSSMKEHFIFLRPNLTFNPAVMIRLGWVARELQGAACLLLCTMLPYSPFFHVPRDLKSSNHACMSLIYPLNLLTSPFLNML